ncbi:MAG: DUF3100 domain-containing protein [Bifidobacteriaceae bacterium]|jgi:hypothetical protein|nr:DUF3100 domain-containing protein [Bifidobacteriaceae bacterium]
MTDAVSATLEEDKPATMSTRIKGILILALTAFVVACGSQLIGTHEIPIGSVSITILPMVYAIIIGAIISAQKIKPFSIPLQNSANSLVSVSVLLVMASLSFSIGPNLGIVVSAGPALLLQEVGHLIGTLVLALPLALLLGMGPSTIGATFSIDREGSFAMVSEKYGADSDEYRGVLSMYIFGTVFGAVVISLLVSVVTSLHWFNPKALAMGAGVGSGSMMGAATAVISEEYPALASQVQALAATSNVITTLLGVYVGFFVALPLAHRIYHFATKNKNSWIGRRNLRSDAATAAVETAAEESVVDADVADAVAVDTVSTAAPSDSAIPAVPKTSSPALDTASGSFTSSLAEPKDKKSSLKGAKKAVTKVVPASQRSFIGQWGSVAVVMLLGIPVAWIADGKVSWEAVACYGVFAALIYLGLFLSKFAHIPALLTVVTIGVLISSPWSPISGFIATVSAHVVFVSICTIMLSLAGLSMGKDIGQLRQISWKIIPVGLVAILSSYIFAVMVAEFILGYW